MPIGSRIEELEEGEAGLVPVPIDDADDGGDEEKGAVVVPDFCSVESVVELIPPNVGDAPVEGVLEEERGELVDDMGEGDDEVEDIDEEGVEEEPVEPIPVPEEGVVGIGEVPVEGAVDELIVEEGVLPNGLGG